MSNQETLRRAKAVAAANDIVTEPKDLGVVAGQLLNEVSGGRRHIVDACKTFLDTLDYDVSEELKNLMEDKH